MAEPPDLSEKYNTKLSADDEQNFQTWAKANPRLGNTYDYDSRGFWKAGAQEADNGHGSDKWKKPNHPTFSNESQYSGKDGNVGGEWGKDGAKTFTPSATNLKNMSADDLKATMSETDPDYSLVLPEPSKADKRYGKAQ